MFFLTENKKINMDNFYTFISEISKKEKQIINNTLKKRKFQQQRNTVKYQKYLEKIKSLKDISKYDYTYFDLVNPDEYEKFINFSPICFRDIEDHIFRGDNYKTKYYLHGFYHTTNYDPSFKMMLEQDIHKICEEYLKSIVWSYEYYFNKCPSWRWYYKYDFAPLMIDFCNFLKKTKEIKFTKDKPYSPDEQLKIVLPKIAKTYMYPSDTPLYSLFKTYHWECHSILPHE
jgi:5'-3' exonuclease